MGPQIACLRGCILTLVTFVKQFCNVLSIESSRRQAMWMRNHAGSTSLILFSTVRFQMCPEGICLKGRIITLIPLFQLDPLCLFNCIHFYPVKPLEVVTGAELPIITISLELGCLPHCLPQSHAALAAPPELCGPLAPLYLEYIAPPLLAKD